MKASVKFRDHQKPLLRAKVPLSILGLPFQSAVAASAASKDLTLSLSTLFSSGPSLRLSYRPNDPSSPFSLLLQSGLGCLASPILFSAHLNLLAATANPSFTIHFRPTLGDFSFKTSHSTESESFDVGAAVSTAVPVLRCAAVKFRWGLRVGKMSGGGGVLFREPPVMVLDKIGIEHVDGGDSGSDEGSLGNKDLELGCFGMRRQFEALEMENGVMKKGIENLRNQMKLFSNSGHFPPPDKEPAPAPATVPV